MSAIVAAVLFQAVLGVSLAPAVRWSGSVSPGGGVVYPAPAPAQCDNAATWEAAGMAANLYDLAPEEHETNGWCESSSLPEQTEARK